MKTGYKKNLSKIAVCIVAVLCVASIAEAQQQQSFSQYHLNDFIFNPAIAGTKEFTSFQSVYRKQWVGVEGEPQTGMAYIQGAVKSRAGNVGLGVALYTDKAAAIKRTGLTATYAQHWAVNESVSFSLGLTGNAEQYSLDREILAKSLDPNDPLLGNTSAKMAFDAGFSAYVYGDKWSIGGYANDLLQSRLDFYNGSQAKLARHYFLMAQYEFKLDEEGAVGLLPAVLVKAAANTPSQLDINLNLIHNNNKWIGLSYRTNQTHSLSGNVGLILSDKLLLGYAYDMVGGKQNQFNAGQNSSHEITLGLRFGGSENATNKQLRCPLL